MKKHFYSEFVKVETFYIELDNLNLSEKEKNHLKEIFDTSLYHSIMDVVLLELPKSDKKLFLENIAHEDHEKTNYFLKKRILNIEEKIKRKAKELIEEMTKDIEQISKS